MNFIFDTAIFFLTVYIFFYLPAKFLFLKLGIQLKGFIALFLYCIVGLLIFTLLSYILSWLHLFYLIIFLILLVDLYTIKKYGFKKIKINNENKIPCIFICILAIIFSLAVATTGIYGNTIAYRGDDIVHLAYINEFKAHFPPQNPGFSGLPLKGYHFFYDFLIAKTSLLTTIPNESLYFHLYPLFISLFWGIGVYTILLTWTKKISAGLWGVFLSFFGGSFGFILRLQGHPKATLGSVFGIDQPASTILNPPFSISVVLVLATILILLQYLRTQKTSWLFPLVLCLGLTSMFKVYAGMIVLGGFAFVFIIQLIRKKFSIILAGVGIAILFELTFGIFIGKGQGLIFFPLWEPHTVLIANLPWYGYEEKIYTYSRLHVIKGILDTELYGLKLYFIGNLGTRFIGMLIVLYIFIKKRKLPSLFSLTLIVMLLVSILIPLFFIQTGKVFEIIQLAWYYPILCSLFAAAGFAYLSEIKIHSFIKFFLTVSIIIFSLPSAYETYTVRVLPFLHEGKVNLSSPYFQTMNYLKSQGNYDATVLEIPPKKTSIANLNGFYGRTSPHLSAFANKRSYLNSEFILFPNMHIEPRIHFLSEILQLENISPQNKNYKALKSAVEKELIANNIAFIYSTFPLQISNNSQIIKKSYANEGYYIYKITP